MTRAITNNSMDNIYELGIFVSPDGRRSGKHHPATHTNNSTPASQGGKVDVVKTSTLSVNAKEFVPTTSQVSQYEVYDEVGLHDHITETKM